MIDPIDAQWKLPSAGPKMRLVREDEPSEAIDYKVERRAHRRFDVEARDVQLRYYNNNVESRPVVGRVLDLSASGIRIRTTRSNLVVDQHVRVQLELPDDGGISPFIDASGPTLRPKRDWVGWMSVSRVKQGENGTFEVAGQLVDMEEMDRGMLSLYLSTQPLAA